MKTVCLGEIIAVHGTKGQVRIKAHTEHPADIASYGVIKDVKGHKYILSNVRTVGSDTVTSSIQGVTDQLHAEALCGTKLFIERSILVLQARRLH